MHQSRRLLLSAIGLAAAFAGAASAQIQAPSKPLREYRALPFDGDLAAVLKDQLLTVKGKESLQALVDEMRKNPEKYQALAAKNKDLLKAAAGNHLDEKTLKQLENLVKNSDLGPKAKITPEQVQAIDHVLKAQQERSSTAHQSNSATAKQPAKQSEIAGKDTLTQRALDLMEHSRVGNLDELAKKSSAIQLTKQRTAGGDPLGKALAKLKLRANGSDLALLKLDWLPRLRASASALKSNAPDFSILSGTPSLGLPPIMKPSGGTLLQILLGLAVVGAAAFAVWKLLARNRAGRLAAASAGLGPWPIQPNQVATSQQLVKAFEYLAILLLGDAARTANHRTIARGLGVTPQRREAADRLAMLYEKARYDLPAGDLSPADFAAARPDLCLLANIGETASAPGEG
jgi:hypothetical protein